MALTQRDDTVQTFVMYWASHHGVLGEHESGKKRGAIGRSVVSNLPAKRLTDPRRSHGIRTSTGGIFLRSEANCDCSVVRCHSFYAPVDSAASTCSIVRIDAKQQTTSIRWNRRFDRDKSRRRTFPKFGSEREVKIQRCTTNMVELWNLRADSAFESTRVAVRFQSRASPPDRRNTPCATQQ